MGVRTDKIKKGDIIDDARSRPKLDIYDVYELKVRTVEDTYFSTIDKRDKKVICFLIMILARLYFLIDKMLLIKRNAQKNVSL